MATWDDEIRQVIAEVLSVLRSLAKYEHYTDVIPRAGPPANAGTIASYEQYLGCRLPASYKSFLSMHNGYRWLAFPGHMLAIEDTLPGGEYWENIKEWKLGMAEVGLTDALDGIVIAYLDQPNNWAYLDPNRRSDDGEMTVALRVPGADPDYYPNVVEFLRSSAERARMMEGWAIERTRRS